MPPPAEQGDPLSLVRFTSSGHRRVLFHHLVGEPLSGPLFNVPPRIGFVIGTFGSPAYVHLHLEARRRLFPEVPVLVHDDASQQTERLAALCEEYGAEFSSNSERAGHQRGDLSILIAGLHWARANGIDLLVKMSRRFLPLEDWTGELSALAMDSQYATYSSWTKSWGYGFRSECLAVAVQPWFDLGLVRQAAAKLLGHSDLLVEAFLHDLARQAALRNCAEARAYDARVGQRPPERNGYAVWEFMGFDRMAPSPRFLWHNASPSFLYFEVAQRWSLPWIEEDFRAES